MLNDSRIVTVVTVLIIGAFVIGIGVKLGKDETQIEHFVRVLEKDPDGEKTAAGIFYLGDKCDLHYPRTLQVALDRYAASHPRAKEPLLPVPKTTWEGAGQMLGEQLVTKVYCPRFKEKLKTVGTQKLRKENEHEETFVCCFHSLSRLCQLVHSLPRSQTKTSVI
jgi:hypothetical protein